MLKYNSLNAEPKVSMFRTDAWKSGKTRNQNNYVRGRHILCTFNVKWDYWYSKDLHTGRTKTNRVQQQASMSVKPMPSRISSMEKRNYSKELSLNSGSYWFPYSWLFKREFKINLNLKESSSKQGRNVEMKKILAWENTLAK